MDYLVIMMLVWGLFAGVVFSSIGAAGGILVSFGLISIAGISDPNSVKLMTQLVVLSTALVFVPNYFRRSALVWPLGLLLSAGGLVGAWLGSNLSSIYLADMKTFRPLFGILTLVIAAQIIWKLYFGNKNQGRINEKADDRGVRQLTLNLKKLQFSYGGIKYEVPHWSPFLAGFVIASIAAIFGVGGGFLFVPYLSSILGMPMHIIPATAAISIIISLVMSIGNYIALGAKILLYYLLPVLLGAVVGALLGPVLNRWTRNSHLQWALAIMVALIGLRYIFS